MTNQDRKIRRIKMILKVGLLAHAYGAYLRRKISTDLVDENSSNDSWARIAIDNHDFLMTAILRGEKYEVIEESLVISFCEKMEAKRIEQDFGEINLYLFIILHYLAGNITKDHIESIISAELSRSIRNVIIFVENEYEALEKSSG